MSADGDKALFVELKTDISSRRDNQDKYLLAAQNINFSDLLNGVLDIFRASNSKNKYFYLLQELEGMNLLQIPKAMNDIMKRPNLQGIVAASKKIKIITRATCSKVIYVQPHGTGDNIISFEDFCTIIEKHNDPVAKRFATSLKKWASIKAGKRTS